MADPTTIAPGRLRCLGPKEQDLDVVIERLRDERRQPAAIVTYASMEFRRTIANGARAFQRRKSVEHTSDGFLSHLMDRGEKQAAHCFHMFARDGCGYDLRELIGQHALDGGEHEAACPRCGRTVSWRAPQG